jgi:UDP-N-acetylglucosamine 2-epimerase (non-hydrolysing)
MPTRPGSGPGLEADDRNETPGPLVTVIAGTRPEIVKLAPVVRALNVPTRVRLVLSGQHQDMVAELTDELGLRPDAQLGVMRERQTLNSLAARLIDSVSGDLTAHRPDAVVVQGDTTTALCGALAAFHESIPVAHVEAGLRSDDPCNPFPEEANRRLISELASWHFAPTQRAADRLVSERHDPGSIEVTGNTVVDSLLWIQNNGAGVSAFRGPPDRRVLVTLHRRETQGAEMLRLTAGLAQIASALRLELVLPLHRSPSVRESISACLADNPFARLIEPLPYRDFIATLADAAIVVTDSGGVVEEATALGVPALIARKVTERSEAVDANCARLVGTSPAQVAAGVRDLVTHRDTRTAMARRASPFGDGRAALRIRDRLVSDLTVAAPFGSGRSHTEVLQCVST